jgi:hypothetical protein
VKNVKVEVAPDDMTLALWDEITIMVQWRRTCIDVDPVSWFMTRFESRGAHRCGEQWNTMDTRVYTGSGLCEDKNPMSYVCRLYYGHLGRDPLYPSFYRLRG